MILNVGRRKNFGDNYKKYYKYYLIGPQSPAPPTVVKSVYWGLEDTEHTIHTKFNIYDCMLTLNNTTKN